MRPLAAGTQAKMLTFPGGSAFETPGRGSAELRPLSSAAPPSTRVVRNSELRDGLLAFPSNPAHEGFLNIAPFDHLHVRTQPTPPEWTAALREQSPFSTSHGWLELVWEGGDPWIPGHRWTLYEMLHERFIDDEILDELRGPHPRSEGHMCSVHVPGQFQCLCRRKLESWRGGPCVLVTKTQWELYRRTGYFGRLFWVIQGENGGHKAEFNEQEKEMLRLHGLPGDAPRIGERSYAPFDGRVIRHINRHNRLKQFGMSLREFKRAMGADYERHKEHLARGLREQYVKWFDEQLHDVNDLFLRAARTGAMDDERKTSMDWEKVEDVATHQFVETGHLPSAREIIPLR